MMQQLKIPIHKHKHLRRACISTVAALLIGGLIVQTAWPWKRLYTLQDSGGTVPALKLSIVNDTPKPRTLETAHGVCNTSSSTIECIDQRRHNFWASLRTSWTFEPPKNLSTVCTRNASKLVLVFVPVSSDMLAERTAVRQTWGSRFEHLTFVVHLHTDQPIGADLAEEAKEFSDLFVMRGPMDDSYQCLTLKVLAFLRWFSLECRNGFHYLMKSDHDSYWHAASVIRLLSSRVAPLSRNQKTNSSKGYNSQLSALEVLGCIQYNAWVARDPKSKFCVPFEYYGLKNYPDYASGGPGYLLSRDAAVALIAAADLPEASIPFKLEDVYITGMLAKTAANLTRSPISYVHSQHINYQVSWPLNAKDVLAWPPLAIHGLNERQMRQLDCWMQRPGIDMRAKALHMFS